MDKINRIALIVGLVACIICLVASIWMASVLRDPTSYLFAVIFLLASVWLGTNIRRNRQQN